MSWCLVLKIWGSGGRKCRIISWSFVCNIWFVLLGKKVIVWVCIGCVVIIMLVSGILICVMVVECICIVMVIFMEVSGKMVSVMVMVFFGLNLEIILFVNIVVVGRLICCG